MRYLKIIIFYSSVMHSIQSYAQVNGSNSFPGSGPVAIMSGKTPTGYQLYIHGSVLQWGVGASGVNAPNLFLKNLTPTTGRNFYINSADAGALQIIDETASNALRFIINNAGNIGMGTSIPISKLQVNGNVTVGGSTTNGGVVGTVQITTGGGSPISNRLTFGSDGTGWKFAVSKNQAGTVIDYLTIQDNGLVGIGTTSPGYNLDVTGTGRFTSSVTGNSFIKSGGTSTQFLKADGSVDANTYLRSNQTITVSGDLSGSGTTTLPLSLTTVNNTVGTFTNANITVDAKGRITAASNGSAGVPASGISGNGTVNYLPKFAGSQVVGNSLLYENGNGIGVGVNPFFTFEAKGSFANNNVPVISASGYNIGWDESRFYSPVIKSQVGLSNEGNDLGGLTYWNDGNVFGSGLVSNQRLILNYGHSGAELTFLRLQNPGTNLGNYTLEFKNIASSVSNPYGMWHSNWGNQMIAWNAPLNIGTLSNYPLRFYADPGNANRVADIFIQNSRIGIGTETPDANAKLDVNGNIYANGKIVIGTTDITKISNHALAVNGSAIFTKAIVKLNANWPDYVFHKDYKLQSLEEIEQFVNLNYRLPEIPAAKEIEKNGIDLGNNQALLLKKIEELTLLLIQQNKRIKSLENQIKR